MQNSTNLRVFSNICSSIARNKGGERKADETSGQQWGGVGAIVGGSTVEESSISKNRPSHHKYLPPKQFAPKELKGSKST